ncbi:MAG TPA: toll/interleukin-1 receptor domain-containing protein [Longimicrobium sp.]|nr:toll/interleukin-1 receptor domain-containing protein [Longimicrobium sp.]
MDNKAAIALLRSGRIGEWNAYRERFPEWIPNLSSERTPVDLHGVVFAEQILGGRWKDINLSRAVLAGARLGQAMFVGADLRSADLRSSVLVKADLRKADLQGAKLDGADLTLADLRGADLSGATFQDAVLIRSRFLKTSLSGANFASAIFGATQFTDVDLSDALDLATTRHVAESFVTVTSLLRSGGRIPREFLLGCGIPSLWADYIPSLIEGMGPIQFHSCFISYSSQESPIAARIHEDLEAAGIRCWFAPEDMKLGSRIRVALDEAIQMHDKLLLILSTGSVESQWVEQEVEAALERERSEGTEILVPIRVDDSIFKVSAGWAKYLRNTRNIGNFCQWTDPEQYQRALTRLLRDLTRPSSRPETGADDD